MILDAAKRLTLTAIRRSGRVLSNPVIVACCLTCLTTSGCLTRTTNPTLPYVKPANSGGPVEQGSTQVASKIQDLESEIQRLRDKLERVQSSPQDDKNIRELMDRVSQIEKQVGVETARKATSDTFPTPAGSGGSAQKTASREEQPAASRQQPANLDHSDDAGEIRSGSVGPEEKAYRQAYATFKSGALEQAVTQFEDYLKKNPKSQFAPSAIYWIGEARLEQGRFDEAVLQFDRVIKEYPGSKKELSALYKQGQAFEKMGDFKSAKIIFQKIVKDNPHTTQGRLAAGRLKSLANTE